MSNATSHATMHDENKELGYEPDVKSSDMVTVGIYFVVLVTLFYVTVGGLFMYFRYEADQHIDKVVGKAPTAELAERRAEDQKALSTIDDGMKAVAAELK